MAAAAGPICRNATTASPVSSPVTQSALAFDVRRPTAGTNLRRTKIRTAGKTTLSLHCFASRVINAGLAEQPLRTSEEAVTPSWDVVGLGQPMVDFSASVDDDLLVRLGIVKGSRRYLVEVLCDFIEEAALSVSACCRVISAQQRAEVLQALENTPYQASV